MRAGACTSAWRGAAPTAVVRCSLQRGEGSAGRARCAHGHLTRFFLPSRICRFASSFLYLSAKGRPDSRAKLLPLEPVRRFQPTPAFVRGGFAHITAHTCTRARNSRGACRAASRVGCWRRRAVWVSGLGEWRHVQPHREQQHREQQWALSSIESGSSEASPHSSADLSSSCTVSRPYSVPPEVRRGLHSTCS